MSSATPGPSCPRCRRPIAAWRLAHCVYCGENFPPDFKEGFAEPDSLKWVERPAVPVDAAKQLEMMKVLPWEPKKTRSRFLLFAAGVSVVLFTAIFGLLFGVVRRSMPTAGPIVLVVGAIFIGYLAWIFLRSLRRNP